MSLFENILYHIDLTNNSLNLQLVSDVIDFGRIVVGHDLLDPRCQQRTNLAPNQKSANISKIKNRVTKK